MRNLALPLALLFVSPVFTEDDDNLAAMKWNKFTLKYPKETWKIETLEKKDDTINVRLTATKDAAIALFITLRDDFPEADEKFTRNPTMAAIAAGLPIALKMADNKSDRVSVTFGQINFNHEWSLSARFLVRDPQGAGFKYVESFMSLIKDPHHAVMGAMITEGKSGDVSDNPDYFERVREAYAVLQDLEIEGGNK